MIEYTQDTRLLALETPLGKDALLLAKFEGLEEMSGLYSYWLEMFSEDQAISPRDIVGKNVTVTLRLHDDSERYFNGFVSQFAYCGTDDRLSRYRAEVVPWLWFLTRTADCRIFQAKTVPEIIELVFQDLGFQDYKFAHLKGKHPKWEYCVQYRETDFNFLSRLMEKEGIFYYFTHDDGGHQLVLADHTIAYRNCPGNEVRVAASLSATESTDQITAWEHRHGYPPGGWSQTDYDFRKPSADLTTSARTLVDFDGIGKYEIYDYPGDFTDREVGEAETRIRMEEQEVSQEVVAGSSLSRTFFPGGKFKIKGHQSKAEEGKEYVITSVRHAASQAGVYLTGGDEADHGYRNTFTCIPAMRTFRPPRRTPKAIVHGPQTAVVVGPAGGRRIYTDRYSRVKVQFHWDRYGKRNEHSSCWMRVCQRSAGKGWGAVHLPHVGNEVLVDFLEGDPDRPIITGCVYNAENIAPVAKFADNTGGRR